MPEEVQTVIIPMKEYIELLKVKSFMTLNDKCLPFARDEYNKLLSKISYYEVALKK